MEQRPKLLEQVRDIIGSHYSYRTEESYVNWIRRYILFQDKRHRSYWVVLKWQHFAHLAMDEQVAASTLKIRLSALLSLPESSKAGVGDAIDAVRAKQTRCYQQF